MTLASSRALGSAAVAAALLGACGSPKSDDTPFTKQRQKPASFHADSTRIVALATHALGDSIPLRVEALTKGTQGWQVRLLPMRGGTVGGGAVWVDSEDSTATVIKRY